MKRWKIWVLAICAGIVLLGIAGSIYIGSSAPSPKVTLTFQGFITNGTNREAKLCFKNEGEAPVWQNGGFKIVSPTGIVGWASYGGLEWAMKPSSNFVMPLEVPDNCPRWRVQAGFVYYQHVPIKRRFMERYVFPGKFNIKPHAPLNNTFFRTVLWCLDRLRQPKELHGTVMSDYITNAAGIGSLVSKSNP